MIYTFLFNLFVIIHCTTQSPQAAVPAPIPYDSLKVALEGMYDLDQGLREKVLQMNTYDPELVARMNQVDSLNQIKLKQIMQQYGWLPSSKVGAKVADAIFYIIQHGDKALMEANIQTLIP